jgi:hypothetical protein
VLLRPRSATAASAAPARPWPRLVAAASLEVLFLLDAQHHDSWAERAAAPCLEAALASPFRRRRPRPTRLRPRPVATAPSRHRSTSRHSTTAARRRGRRRCDAMELLPPSAGASSSTPCREVEFLKLFLLVINRYSFWFSVACADQMSIIWFRSMELFSCDLILILRKRWRCPRKSTVLPPPLAMACSARWTLQGRGQERRCMCTRIRFYFPAFPKCSTEFNSDYVWCTQIRFHFPAFPKFSSDFNSDYVWC